MRIGELLQLKASPDGILPITIPPSPDAVDQTPQVHQCEAELREMDMIEACRADELRESEVNFDVEA
jgi:hypothetical protein